MNITDLKNKNNKKVLTFLTVFLYFALLFCFQPKLFVKYTIPNIVYIAGLVISFGCILGLYWMERKNFSKVFYLLVAYRASFFLQTVLSKGDILMWGYMSIVLISLCLLIDYFASFNAKILLNAIINILTILLSINLLLSFIFPEGIIEDLHFIGIRTRLTDVIFPLLTCSLIRLFSEKKYTGELEQKLVYIKTAYIAVLSLFTIIHFRIATAYVGIGVFVVAFFIFFVLSKLRNIWLVVVAGLLVNYLIVFLNITQYFEWFISGVLGKDPNLSGRTELWTLAIDIIRKKLLFGYGMADNGNFVYWGYVGGPRSYWQSHNQWLQLLYDGGLITLFLFVLLIVSVGKKFKHTDKKICSVVLACVASFMVMMITEIYSYTPYFFIIIFISQYLDLFKATDHVVDSQEVNTENQLTPLE